MRGYVRLCCCAQSRSFIRFHIAWIFCSYIQIKISILLNNALTRFHSLSSNILVIDELTYFWLGWKRPSTCNKDNCKRLLEIEQLNYIRCLLRAAYMISTHSPGSENTQLHFNVLSVCAITRRWLLWGFPNAFMYRRVNQLSMNGCEYLSE